MVADTPLASMIQNSIEPYAGKDPNLHETVYCKICLKQKKEGNPLLKCTRCKLVYYCSSSCQKEDFSSHKQICKRIQDLTNSVEKEAAPLRSTREHIFGAGPIDPVNLFEEEVGNFWGMFDTRDYMRTRLALANEIHDGIAWDYETKESWEAVLEHYQDMLRLCSSDNLGLRFRFPFLLLNLNRDDDAFDFIRFWFKVDDGNLEARQSLHAESQVGDWLYGHQEDCRFLDIFEECPDARPEYMSLPLLVAVACIKMRLVAAFEASRKSIQQFQSTSGGKSLEAVESVVSKNVLGDDALQARMRAQQGQLDRILDLIHSNNATMLPALLNPQPLQSQPAPQYYSPRSPSECHSVLEDSCRVWARIPGSLEVLQARFGPNPTYDSNMNV